MNEDIEKLKEKLKKILENYEIDKKIGQLSVDSIYHMFPTESEALLNYLEQLQNNWNTLKQKLEKTIKSIEKESLINFKKEKKCYQTVLNEMLEMEKENE